MPRSHAEKLLTSLPKVPGASRRQQYSASTKRALVEVATAQFSEHGYGGTSLDSIVAGARVTKGALYHHFSGKQGVFEAVFAKVEDDAVDRPSRQPCAAPPTRGRRRGPGCGRSSPSCRSPVYQRVVIQDGPAILGYERFREQEERSSYGIVQDIVGSVLEASTYELDEPMKQTFSRIFFGAMSAAGESVTTAEDPDAGSGAHRGGDPVHPRGTEVAGRAGRRTHRPRGDATRPSRPSPGSRGYLR